MAYSKSVADRVRHAFSQQRGIEEKRMFGGIAFLLHGNMCVGVWMDWLIVRVGLDDYETSLALPYAKKFDITGRLMKGWVMVAPDGVESDKQLQEWIDRGWQFAETLPSK